MINKEFLVEIGARLKFHRKSLNLTQATVAELLNISLNFYGAIERGEKRISLEKIILASEKLDLDPTYLLTGKERQKMVISELVKDCPQNKIFDLEQMIRYASNLYR
ncbi:MAG: helix-turn-helix transcriptional regulator [Christensenellaceae bacterium]